MRVGIHRDQKGGQVSLLSPASLLARPLALQGLLITLELLEL